MASKLRRAPLFGYDSGLRLVTGYSPQYGCKNKPAYPMECSVSRAAYPAGGGATPANGILAEVRSERSPAKSELHVNFLDKGEVKERREKFLTAKYGSHQMSLIRKRLAVEMWMYDELQKLYNAAENSERDEADVDLDIDMLLDMDDDNQRRQHLRKLLVDAKKSSVDVNKFVEDLLERAKTL